MGNKLGGDWQCHGIWHLGPLPLATAGEGCAELGPTSCRHSMNGDQMNRSQILARGGINGSLPFQAEIDGLFGYKRVRAIVELLDQTKGDHRRGEKAKGKSTQEAC